MNPCTILFMTWKKNAFENVVGKVGNVCDKHFFPFLKIFSTSFTAIRLMLTTFQNVVSKYIQ